MNSEHLSLRIYPADVPDIWDFEHLIQGMTLDDQIVIENMNNESLMSRIQQSVQGYVSFCEPMCSVISYRSAAT